MKKKISTGTPQKTRKDRRQEKRKKAVSIQRGKKLKYPFMIHADPLKEDTAFPTHTHGLAKIGWPEFFMDPIAFGGEGNAGKINAAYRYFSQPGNAGKLEAILSGEIIKLHSKDLYPGTTENFTYCFREVPHYFEGVRLAYPYEDEIKGARTVQIWVEGDDFALMDEYYLGGVKW